MGKTCCLIMKALSVFLTFCLFGSLLYLVPMKSVEAIPDSPRFDTSGNNLAFNKPVDSNYPGGGFVIDGASLFSGGNFGEAVWYADPWGPPCWLRIDLGEVYQIDTIDTLHAACHTWNSFSRPKDLQIEFDDGQSVIVTRDTVSGFKWCRNTFPLHSTRYVKISVLSVESLGGVTYPTCTGFNEINIYGLFQEPPNLPTISVQSPASGEAWPLGSS